MELDIVRTYLTIHGCIAAAKTKVETLKLFKEASEIHLEDSNFKKLPKLNTEIAYIKVA